MSFSILSNVRIRSSEVHDRLSKIDKLRKRYEILMVAMAPPEGQEEEEASQTYYVIKAAQEREELQRKGDDLDAKIQKAEREIKALENTLKLMNGRNEVVRKGFTKVDNQGMYGCTYVCSLLFVQFNIQVCICICYRGRVI